MDLDWIFRRDKHNCNKYKLSKSKQRELLNKCDIYEDTEIHFIFMSYKVTEDFMRKIFYKFGPPPSMKYHKGCINDWIHWQSNISESFLRQFKDYIDWEEISIKLISNDFLREFKDDLDWTRVSMNHKFDLKLTKEFKDKVRRDLLEGRGYNGDSFKKIFE